MSLKFMTNSALWLYTIASFGITAVDGESEKLPTYNCLRTNEPIIIDGLLKESVWQKAEEAKLLLTDSSKEPEFKTAARLLWDDEYLYIGFSCEDKDIWGSIQKHDGDIYNEEVVEIFLDTDSDGKTYLEFELSPINIFFDAFVINPGDRRKGGFRVLRDWNSDQIKHAVHIEGKVKVAPTGTGTDKLWTCEIAIPFVDMVPAPNLPPKDGDVWRMNLYRIERPKGKAEFSAWSPTGKIDYHMPEKFGYLKFRREL